MWRMGKVGCCRAKTGLFCRETKFEGCGKFTSSSQRDARFLGLSLNTQIDRLDLIFLYGS